MRHLMIISLGKNVVTICLSLLVGIAGTFFGIIPLNLENFWTDAVCQYFTALTTQTQVYFTPEDFYKKKKFVNQIQLVAGDPIGFYTNSYFSLKHTIFLLYYFITIFTYFTFFNIIELY